MIIPAIEKKTFKEIDEYQEKRLKVTLDYINNKSVFYQSFFKKNKIDISKINTLEDISFIKPTTKSDLQKNNMNFLCVDRKQVIDYNTTSGTTGDPVTFATTENDLKRLEYNEYLSFLCANGTREDIYQIIVTLDRRFMAGLAYFMGARRLGAGVVRVGPGNPELHFDTINRIKPTSLVTVPSFILKLIDYAEKNNIDYKNSSVKSAICIGEPIRNINLDYNVLGRKILSKWNLQLFSTYASTEMGAAFTECIEGKGGHHHPELLIVEFLDSNDNPVNEGEIGELTVTTLGVEAMPMLRFKTGDVCKHYKEPCKCGRNTIRIGPILGRKNQMIKYKGTTLYPSAFYDILNEISGVNTYVIELSTSNINTDEILIKIGTERRDEELIKRIKNHFRAKLRVAPAIELFTTEEITKLQFPKNSRKAIKFIDKRKNAFNGC